MLWFDLMFDVQVSSHRGADVPEATLASIASYYRRVTREARPMNRLVAAAMLATISAIVVELARGSGPAWMRWSSLVLAVAPIALAGSRTVPNAVRLGGRGDRFDGERALARSILLDHVLCFASVATLLQLCSSQTRDWRQKRVISADGPMTIAGESLGLSQRSISSRSVNGTLTQPLVASPMSACTKMAEPANATTGAVLYSTTTKLGYAAVSVHNASLAPPNGGLAGARQVLERVVRRARRVFVHQSPHTNWW